MKLFFIKLNILLFWAVCCTNIYAQLAELSNYPELDKSCPPFFLKDISYFPKKMASRDDFNGRWLILDFWNRHCSACITSFPHINELQKQFENNVKFMLIGSIGTLYGDKSDNIEIRKTYEKFRKKWNLELSINFDSTLFKQFDIGGCPYIIIIDPNGIVRGLTNYLTKDDLIEFLNGKTPDLERVYNIHQQNEIGYAINSRTPFLINGNGGSDTDYIYRSILAQWRPGVEALSLDEFGSVIYPVHLWQTTHMSLWQLYNCAYSDTSRNIPEEKSATPNCYGKYWKKPILELEDSSEFRYNPKTGAGLYSYSLSVPSSKANTRYMQRVLQRDLENYFGYNVRIESRLMPCLKLIASENAKINLLTKGGLSKGEGDGYSNFSMINGSITEIIRSIWNFHQDSPPIFDETGIKGKIDISLEAIMTDLNDIKRALQKNGLDLVNGEKEMQVIVIRDKK